MCSNKGWTLLKKLNGEMGIHLTKLQLNEKTGPVQVIPEASVRTDGDLIESCGWTQITGGTFIIIFHIEGGVKVLDRLIVKPEVDLNALVNHLKGFKIQ